MLIYVSTEVVLSIYIDISTTNTSIGFDWILTAIRYKYIYEYEILYWILKITETEREFYDGNHCKFLATIQPENINMSDVTKIFSMWNLQRSEFYKMEQYFLCIKNNNMSMKILDIKFTFLWHFPFVLYTTYYVVYVIF